MTRRNRWPLVATYTGEEITVHFTATGVRGWYGHPDVPNGTQECESIENIEVHSVDMFGKPVPFDAMPDVVKDMLHALHDEVEWSHE